MTSEATAYVTLPGNRTGSVPDITVTDDDGNRQTLWDFTAYAPEHQTLGDAEELLRDSGWRPVLDNDGEYTWQPARNRWTLRVETI